MRSFPGAVIFTLVLVLNGSCTAPGDTPPTSNGQTKQSVVNTSESSNKAKTSDASRPIPAQIAVVGVVLDSKGAPLVGTDVYLCEKRGKTVKPKFMFSKGSFGLPAT